MKTEIPRDVLPSDPDVLRLMDEIEGWAEIGDGAEAARGMVGVPYVVKQTNPIFVGEIYVKIFIAQKQWRLAEEYARELIEKFPHRVFGYEALIRALKAQKTSVHLQHADEIRRRGASTLLDLAKLFSKDAACHDLVRPCLEGSVQLEPKMRRKISASKRLSKFLRR